MEDFVSDLLSYVIRNAWDSYGILVVGIFQIINNMYTFFFLLNRDLVLRGLFQGPDIKLVFPPHLAFHLCLYFRKYICVMSEFILSSGKE